MIQDSVCDLRMNVVAVAYRALDVARSRMNSRQLATKTQGYRSMFMHFSSHSVYQQIDGR
jgi:hypothetical protein